MAEGEEQVELKFRIYDGTDIGHGTYISSTAISVLKQRLVHQWPQDKSIAPKSAGDIKLIHAGKILDDGRTLAESRIPIGDVSGGVITMHVVVQPPNRGKKTASWCGSSVPGLWRDVCRLQNEIFTATEEINQE